MTLNLKKLSKDFVEMFSKEPTESLEAWLKKERNIPETCPLTFFGTVSLCLDLLTVSKPVPEAQVAEFERWCRDLLRSPVSIGETSGVFAYSENYEDDIIVTYKICII